MLPGQRGRAVVNAAVVAGPQQVRVHVWSATDLLLNDKKSKSKIAKQKIAIVWAVVMYQLVEHLLPKPEVRGSNLVIGKIYIQHLFTFICIEKTKISKEKEAGNGSSFFKKIATAFDTLFISSV